MQKTRPKGDFYQILRRLSLKAMFLKKNIKLNVTNAALRTVDFKGGLDKYLLTAKNSKLSNKVKKIKAFISSKA